AFVAEELLLALSDGRVLECESARAAEGGVQGGREEARHGEVLRSFRVAGRFAARSDRPADLGDLEREVDRDVRAIAFDDQGGAGADGEARGPIGEQGGRQARRKASAVTFPGMTPLSTCIGDARSASEVAHAATCASCAYRPFMKFGPLTQAFHASSSFFQSSSLKPWNAVSTAALASPCTSTTLRYRSRISPYCGFQLCASFSPRRRKSIIEKACA